MRSNRSDWDEFSRRRQALEFVSQKALASGIDALTPNERALYDSQDRAPRARPVQHESGEMKQLVVWVHRQWWGPADDGRRRGWMRWESAIAGQQVTHQRQAGKQTAEGGVRGWPDCGLFIPPHGTIRSMRAGQGSPPVRAVLELKAQYAKTREAHEPEWWLQWKVPAPTVKRTTKGVEYVWATKAGLSGLQALTLQDLHRTGHETAVCYGADEAMAQLAEWAGPKPDVLPEGW